MENVFSNREKCVSHRLCGLLGRKKGVCVCVCVFVCLKRKGDVCGAKDEAEVLRALSFVLLVLVSGFRL